MLNRTLALVALWLLGCGGPAMSITTSPNGKKIVFLTSASYSGDLQTASGHATGAAAGDALCTTAAEAALLGSHWRAWLSDSTQNAIDRIDDVGPWYLSTGERAFNNKANLATTALTVIEADENGKSVGSWDGSQHHLCLDRHSNRRRSPLSNCSDWSSANGNDSGAAGAFDMPDQWTGSDGSSVSCDGLGYRMHLYCLQQ